MFQLAVASHCKNWDPLVNINFNLDNLRSLIIKVNNVKNLYPNQDFLIRFKDLESQIEGYLSFDQNGTLIDHSTQNTGCARLAETYEYYTIIQRSTHPHPFNKSIDNVSKLLGYGIGTFAAVKAYTGTSGFFGRWISSTAVTSTLGAVSALPSLAFYSENLTNASQYYIYDIIVRKQLKQIKTDEAAFVLPALLEKAFPQIKLSDSAIQMVCDAILGIGYASANLGMVMSAFPTELNIVVLKQWLLFCLGATNLAVGVKKVRKYTDNVKEIVQELFHLDNYNRFESLQVDLLVNALKHYQDMLDSFYNYDKQTVANKIITLKGEFESCRSIGEMLVPVNAAIEDLQADINNKLMPGDIENQFSRVNAFDNINDINGINEEYPLLIQEQPKLLDAKDMPFSCDFSFTAEHKVKGKSLGFFSSLFSAGAITSNVGGIASLLIKISGAVNPWPILGFYIVGIIGSLSAYGLNKSYTDTWKEKFIAIFASKIKISLQQEAARCGGSITASKVAGYIWAAFASTAGMFFTKEALDKLPMFKSGFMWLVTSVLKSAPVEYFCVGATGLMMTSSKGEPTGKLIDRLVDWVKKNCCCCLGQSDKPVIINEELVRYQDEHIKIMLTGLGKLIEHHNRLLERENGCCGCRVDLENMHDYTEVSMDINGALEGLDSRENFMDELTTLLYRYGQDYDNIYYDEEETSESIKWKYRFAYT